MFHKTGKIRGNKITSILLYLAILGLYPLLMIGCGGGYHFETPESAARVQWKKYILRERYFTLNQFVIKDETNTPVFKVKGKLFSIGDKLSFRDLSGNELVYISQRLISFTPRYKIFRGNEEIATIVKKITLFKPSYIINVPGPDDYKVVGDILNYEYTVTRNGREVAYISRRFFSLPNSYGIAIIPGEDDVLILAAAVVIDLVSEKK